MILHQVREGAGPVVLLLHSTATDGRQWRPQIRELSRDFTVVAPDLRGYGSSLLTSEPFSHAGDVVQLIDHLDLKICAVGDQLAAGLPRVTRIELPWAGHLPNLERPAETTELIRRCIGTFDPSVRGRTLLT